MHLLPAPTGTYASWSWYYQLCNVQTHTRYDLWGRSAKSHGVCCHSIAPTPMAAIEDAQADVRTRSLSSTTTSRETSSSKLHLTLSLRCSDLLSQGCQIRAAAQQTTSCFKGGSAIARAKGFAGWKCMMRRCLMHSVQLRNHKYSVPC